MTFRETYTRGSVLPAILGVVLLASVNGKALVIPVIHFQANGAFGQVTSCDASTCVFVSVTIGGPSNSPQTFLYYDLSNFVTGAESFGYGFIPNANVSVGALGVVTVNADTSTIADFTNLVCDVNGCSPGRGGVISGTWQKVNFFSQRNTSEAQTTYPNARYIVNGTTDQISAIAQGTALGVAFSDAGTIGTNHNTTVIVQAK